MNNIIINRIYIFILMVLPLFLAASTDHHNVYFQQRVEYTINAGLDADLKMINANETLVYHNQSPDTLKNIYFYLYMNKFQAGALGMNPPLYRDLGNIHIDNLKINGRPHNNFSVDHTIMQVELPKDLAPGDSVKFIFRFSVQLPPASERFGFMGDHFDVGNWFPTPVVYDRAGWHLHQHLDNEFYQEWGDFRVNIRVPKGFVVGATGDLLNADYALQDTAQAVKENYYNNPDDTATTTWKFKADRVHDFAWTADPDYILMQSEWNGITLNVLAMSVDAPGWRQVTDWGIGALKFYYETYGPYPYKQFTVADTYIRAGGIEYPNIVMINTSIHPDLRLNRFKAVVVHEMAHNWFYGLLGNNQTEEEWMDEGFTTFAEIECMEALFGKEDNYSPNRDTWFRKIFWYENNDRKNSALEYLQYAKQGMDKNPIDLYPDYLGWSTYITQYSKTADVLFMLESVLGDSMFDAAMKNYFNEWKFKHPYRSDFIASFEKTANRNLDWFFQQWLNTNWQLDYAVDDVDGNWKAEKGKKQYYAKIDLTRKKPVFIPIDLDIKLKNGDTVKYHIPVDNNAKHEKGRKVLPYWHFSRNKYTADILLNDEIDKVEIDASQRLMDINRLNNTSGLLPEMDFVFMRPQSNAPPLDAYLWEGWPLVFYNDIDKLKAGFKMEGSYLDMDHLLNLGAWYKAATGNVDFDLSYRHPFGWFGRNFSAGLRCFTLDGAQGAEMNLEKRIITNPYREPIYHFNVDLRSYNRYDNQYPLYPWDPGIVNTVKLKWARVLDRYWEKQTNLSVSLINSIIGSDYSFSKLELDWMANYISRTSVVELMINFKAGISKGNVPVQHLYSLNGSTGWAMFENPWYRAKGTLPYPWYRNGHLYMSTGAQVRGYGLYPFYSNLLGRKKVALSSDMRLPNPFSISSLIFIRDVVPFLFFDGGYVWDHDEPQLDDIRFDAGFSLAWERIPDILGYITSLE
ncbi:MAG: M1 family aminopeptidase, partial [Calditrichaceae bacterium]